MSQYLQSQPQQSVTKSNLNTSDYDFESDPYFRKLSNRFFGNKILLEDKWNKLQSKYQDLDWAKRELTRLYPEYTEQIEQYNIKLLNCWKDFLYSILLFLVQEKMEFQKASTCLEILVHIFQQSMDQRLQENQSFILYNDIINRHCLFRPPTSIKIFDLNDLQKITKYVQSTFYRHYKMYIFAFTPFVNVEIRTHQMFKSRFPISDSLQDAVEIPRAQVELLNQYLLDQETGLTPEQLEEIMRGDSIHMVPAKKRQEWLRQREERERKEKIDRVLKKELEKLEQDFQDKMQKQDDQYLQQVQSIKNPPKKK